MTAIPAAFEPPSFGKAWDLTVKHFATFLVLAIAAVVVGGIAYVLFGVLFYLGMTAISLVLGGGYGSSDQVFTSVLGGYAFGAVGALPFVLIWALLVVLLSAIPAVYFADGEVVTVGGAFKLLMARPWRYILAGLVFSLALFVGNLLLFVPGLAVAFVGPIYVNKIFTTNLGVVEAFTSSFSALYKSEHWLPFVGICLLAGLIAQLASLCSCGLLGFMAIPAISFYIQNVAYRRGILS